jgi:hypothetical protein
LPACGGAAFPKFATFELRCELTASSASTGAAGVVSEDIVVGDASIPFSDCTADIVANKVLSRDAEQITAK